MNDQERNPKQCMMVGMVCRAGKEYRFCRSIANVKSFKPKQILKAQSTLAPEGYEGDCGFVDKKAVITFRCPLDSLPPISPPAVTAGLAGQNYDKT